MSNRAFLPIITPLLCLSAFACAAQGIAPPSKSDAEVPTRCQTAEEVIRNVSLQDKRNPELLEFRKASEVSSLYVSNTSIISLSGACSSRFSGFDGGIYGFGSLVLIETGSGLQPAPDRKVEADLSTASPIIRSFDKANFVSGERIINAPTSLGGTPFIGLWSGEDSSVVGVFLACPEGGTTSPTPVLEADVPAKLLTLTPVLHGASEVIAPVSLSFEKDGVQVVENIYTAMDADMLGECPVQGAKQQQEE